MASTLTALDAVRARIAAAVLATPAAPALGRFTLRPAQQESVTAIRHALRGHAGALVADAAGSGKTVLALAVAAGYDEVLVLTPAAVREQWRRAARDAGVAVRLESHETLSRSRRVQAAPLIIVDEAHHFRNPRSVRYAALARLARGRHLLLLSATPVVNRPADRDALLSLFLGSRPRTPQLLERVILRRAGRPEASVAVRELPSLLGDADVPGLTERLACLPPPLPVADGSSAVALVRITLAMAWSSSLAALDAALRRRIQRGMAMADTLREGRWPTRDALRDWIIGDDATQLALLLDPSELPRTPPPEAAATLARHLDAVHAMRACVAPMLESDAAARADAIRRLLDCEAPRRVVLLARHAETVRALYAQLRNLPGVVAIIGTRVHAAAGRWTRDEVLRALGPRQPPWRPDDPRGIRLLLATDILAEGVELQGCATLIHGDPAWTPARFEQRVGRVARDGQRDTVHVLRFAMPAGAAALLDLTERLRRKREARRRSLAHTTATTALRDAVERWHADPEDVESPAGPVVAAAEGQHDGMLIVLSAGSAQPSRLLAAVHREGRWQVSPRAATAHRLVVGCGHPLQLRGQDLRVARQVVSAWRRQVASRQVVRDVDTLPTPLLRRVAQRLDRWIQAAPLAQRSAAVARARRLQAGLSSARGAGAEADVRSALRQTRVDECLDRLEQLIEERPVLARPATERISALLILRRRLPAAPAPPAPSIESAATR
ncbi:DEAD/DEAH box helicase [Pseudogemmatithrix spongiicola]|uniref:DEAD/DEAH box helicase n=1 Tax=Pseudogemmatithrix spongiicola TaxID=3062599 RepID=A0AA49K2E4_9BACT|nr:DEAD/DEAH box helicase [Gemmatimonadaceae bacterium 'strain 138']WKW16142.1 DEAD/DEAH box helicase [Gemmatimonadaceae bacterium 'strain 318']